MTRAQDIVVEGLEIPTGAPDLPSRIWLLDLGGGDIEWSAEAAPEGEEPVWRIAYNRPAAPIVGESEAERARADAWIWPHSFIHSLERIIASGNPCGIMVYPSEARYAVHAFAALQGQVEVEREEDCPYCEGRDLGPGGFCIVGCRGGKVRWTSANVLRNVKFWHDADSKARIEGEARCEKQDEALRWIYEHGMKKDRPQFVSDALNAAYAKTLAHSDREAG